MGLIKNAKWDIMHPIERIEHHVHNQETWFGDGAVVDSFTPYTFTSGNGIYGNEVLIVDVGDTPFIAGKQFFEFHRLLATLFSSATTYWIQGTWGTGTFADAQAAGQFNSFPMIKPIATGNAQGSPWPILNAPTIKGTKIWARVKNATNLATLECFFGVHEYDE